jgi:hypothetical protein
MQGWGDSLWALPKLQAIASAHESRTVDLKVAVWNKDEAETRAIEMLRRISIVDSVELYSMPRDGRPSACLLQGDPAGEDGIYRYIPDGPTDEYPGVDYVAIANRALDRGVRLEDWLPEYATNWSVFDGLRTSAVERIYAHATEMSISSGSGYVVMFHSSIAGNTHSGWNRDALWKPRQWVDLARGLHDALGVSIISIGASWDRDYWEVLRSDPATAGMAYWRSLIGQLTIGQTLAVIQRARAVYSYPSGIGVVSHYLRRPTCFFWRHHGDPIDLRANVSPADAMATAWTYPDTGDEYLPAWYGETTVDQIVEHSVKAGW